MRFELECAPHPKPLPDGSVSTRPHEEGGAKNAQICWITPLPSLWGARRHCTAARGRGMGVLDRLDEFKQTPKREELPKNEKPKDPLLVIERSRQLSDFTFHSRQSSGYIALLDVFFGACFKLRQPSLCVCRHRMSRVICCLYCF